MKGRAEEQEEEEEEEEEEKGEEEGTERGEKRRRMVGGRKRIGSATRGPLRAFKEG